MKLLIAGFAGLAALVSLADVTWRHVGADPSDILVGTAGGGAYVGHDSETEM